MILPHLRIPCCRILLAPLPLLLTSLLCADTAYYQRVIFDNSLAPDRYYYSAGKVSSPSTLQLIKGQLPVETDTFFTGPNALRVEWKSAPQGGWEAEIRADEWRNREIYFPGNTLAFWCYSTHAIAAADLPRVALRDTGRNFTRLLDIAPFTQGVPAGKWVQIKIPLDRFAAASIHAFEPHRVNTVVLAQGSADGLEHTLIVDQVEIGAEESASVQRPLPPVRNLQAKGYERHIDLSWAPIESENESVARYVVYRSLDGSPFRAIGIQVPGVHRYADFLGKLNQTARYKVTTQDREYLESAPSEVVSASTSAHPMSDQELLTMVQEACFRYYWEGAHPVSGMTRENLPGNDDIIATGASGFGIMALMVASDRGFITRDQALERLLKIVDFLKNADRFHGAWAHFMNGATGHALPVFGMFDDGADIVETSFLMEGLLAARQYFKGSGSAETELRARITHLWNTVEWDWFRGSPNGKAIYWHWSPDYAWYIDHQLSGWNEAMITYLLAIASPTHSVSASLYYTGWAGVAKDYIDGRSYYGIKLDVGRGTGGPLFFTDYSFMGFDPHVRDRFTGYFENSRNAALINRAYCIQNPRHFQGYGANSWGLTAVDGPEGYVDYEPTPRLDDGTIAPTGAVSAFPYTPDASMQALKYFYRQLGDRLWDVYGFRDAFNLQADWFSRINMGLNQAPMVVMIENYRSGLVWKNFMANPEIQTMAGRVGFKTDAPAKESLK